MNYQTVIPDLNHPVIKSEGSVCDKRKRDYNLCIESATLRCTPTISRRFSDRFTG